MKQLKLNETEIKEGAPFAALSYVFFLWILAFLFKKENRFARFHAKQGMLIFICEVIVLFLVHIPILGFLVYIIGIIIFPLLSLYGIYLSLTGKGTYLPVIGELADKLVI